MGWINVKEALPQKSGEYFIACTKNGATKPYYYTCVNYSVKHKQFNSYDSFPTADHSFDDVSHWMEIPEVNEDDAG